MGDSKNDFCVAVHIGGMNITFNHLIMQKTVNAGGILHQ
jgi:hypothetical protein